MQRRHPESLAFADLVSSAAGRKTATSRRKAALKRVAGRKGTVYEEMYLLNSIKKVVEGRHSDLQSELRLGESFPLM